MPSQICQDHEVLFDLRTAIPKNKQMSNPQRAFDQKKQSSSNLLDELDKSLFSFKQFGRSPISKECGSCDAEVRFFANQAPPQVPPIASIHQTHQIEYPLFAGNVCNNQLSIFHCGSTGSAAIPDLLNNLAGLPESVFQPAPAQATSFSSSTPHPRASFSGLESPIPLVIRSRFGLPGPHAELPAQVFDSPRHPAGTAGAELLRAVRDAGPGGTTVPQAAAATQAVGLGGSAFLQVGRPRADRGWVRPRDRGCG